MELIKAYNEENIFKTQFTGSGMAILTLLVLALVGLGERVLYDLGRTFAAPIGDFGYFDNPKVIIVHAIFIVALLIVTISVNYIFGRKREKYAIALVPYFITSIVLAIQLAIQLGAYFTTHHTNLQFYLVMSLLVIVSSYGIFHIQNNYKKTQDTTQVNHTGLLAMFVVVFALFAVLILSFNNTNNQKDSSNMYSNSYYPDMGQQSNNQQPINVPVKNVSGDYVIDFQYLGTSNLHDVSLMQDSQGNLSGNGGSPAAGAHIYAWAINSGSVSGSTINFSAQYTSPTDAITPQTTMNVTGTIFENGTMSGTWSDNYYRGQNRSGNFYTVMSGFKKSDTSNQAQTSNVQTQNHTIMGNDSYPRIMYYEGNVNQHYDTSARSWMTDLDGVSGSEIDKLTYCKKYYPHTIGIAPYKLETPPAWRPYGGNGAGFNATVVSDLCVQPN